jgi:4-hydroxybenzoate polyprenyltransferase
VLNRQDEEFIQDPSTKGQVFLSIAPLRQIEIEPVEPGLNLPPLIRALRPLQWTKNLLVFAALLFTRSVFEFEPLIKSLGAFLSFCAVSSAVYLVNDVRDRDQDSHHPIKCTRPIASGAVSSRRALKLAAVLATLGAVTAVIVRPMLLLVVCAYLGMMLGYTFGLKRIVILDVIIISLGFVLRAAAGAVAIDVPISPWLYICSMLLALMLGFGKRRHEILMLRDVAALHRENLDSYSVPLLDQIIAVTSAATMVTYSIYTFESPALPGSHAMMLTIPFVVYAVFRYLYLIYRQHLGGSPELLLARDNPLQLCIAGWSLACAAILYWS